MCIGSGMSLGRFNEMRFCTWSSVNIENSLGGQVRDRRFGKGGKRGKGMESDRVDPSMVRLAMVGIDCNRETIERSSSIG